MPLALLLVSCSNGCPTSRDTNDPYDLVIKYIKAINSADANQVKPLIDPSFNADAAIADQIKEYGDKQLYYEKMEFDSAGFTDSISVTFSAVSGHPGGTEHFTDKLSLDRKNGRWYIVLGKPR